MSENNVNADTPTFSITNAVEHWLSERNQLLIQFFRLSGSRNNLSLPNEKQLNQFCGLLIDYVSTGHFEVYEQIVNACETNGPASISLLKKLYPEISKTTDTVVNFNDKYSQLKENSTSGHLDNDLSILGEAIAKRVELEDSLIDTLRTKH